MAWFLLEYLDPFGVWSLSWNCLNDTTRNNPGVISLESFWKKWNFILGDKICKHYLKLNHMKENICTCVYFIKARIIGFYWMGHFSQTAPKTNFISFRRHWKVIETELLLLWRVEVSLWVDFIPGLMQTPSNLKFTDNLPKQN